jgi:hypothetical protein
LLGTGVRDMVARQASRLCSDGVCAFPSVGASAGADAVGGGSPAEVDISSVAGRWSNCCDVDVEKEVDVVVERRAPVLGATGVVRIGCST